MPSSIHLRLNPSHISCIDRLATELYNICTDNFHDVKDNWREKLRQSITNIELFEMDGFEETGILGLPYHNEYNLVTSLDVEKPTNTERKIIFSILANKIPLPSGQRGMFEPTITTYTLTTYTDYNLNSNFTVSKYNMSLKFRPSCLRLKTEGRRTKAAYPAHLDAIINLDIDQTIYTTFSPQDNGLLNVQEDYLFGGQESMTRPSREDLLSSKVSLRDLNSRGRDLRTGGGGSFQKSSFDRDRFGRENETQMNEAKSYLRSMKDRGVGTGSMIKRRDSLSALSERLKMNRVPSSRDVDELVSATGALATVLDTLVIESSVPGDGDNIHQILEEKVSELSQFVLGESETSTNNKSMPGGHGRRFSFHEGCRSLSPTTSYIDRTESGLGTSDLSMVWDPSQDAFRFNSPATGSRDTFGHECDYYPSFINPEYISEPDMPYKTDKIRQDILAPVRKQQHHRQSDDYSQPRGGASRPGYNTAGHSTRGEHAESPRDARARPRTPPRDPPPRAGRGRGQAGRERPKVTRRSPMYPADDDFWPEDNRGTSPALKSAHRHRPRGVNPPQFYARSPGSSRGRGRAGPGLRGSGRGASGRRGSVPARFFDKWCSIGYDDIIYDLLGDNIDGYDLRDYDVSHDFSTMDEENREEATAMWHSLAQANQALQELYRRETTRVIEPYEYEEMVVKTRSLLSDTVEDVQRRAETFGVMFVTYVTTQAIALDKLLTHVYKRIMKHPVSAEDNEYANWGASVLANRVSRAQPRFREFYPEAAAEDDISSARSSEPGGTTMTPGSASPAASQPPQSGANTPAPSTQSASESGLNTSSGSDTGSSTDATSLTVSLLDVVYGNQEELRQQELLQYKQAADDLEPLKRRIQDMGYTEAKAQYDDLKRNPPSENMDKWGKYKHSAVLGMVESHLHALDLVGSPRASNNAKPSPRQATPSSAPGPSPGPTGGHTSDSPRGHTPGSEPATHGSVSSGSPPKTGPEPRQPTVTSERRPAPPASQPAVACVAPLANTAKPEAREPNSGLADLEELESVLDPPEQILDDAPGDENLDGQDENGNDTQHLTINLMEPIIVRTRHQSLRQMERIDYYESPL